uniref:GNAT family N-acetyltransferase n=1 Tax=Agrobacterium larrymoorei TaxID=160699 RepID=UPI001F16AC58|nr:GNAT family N-acetyltransferase [Agrobacterium larrymoorei]
MRRQFPDRRADGPAQLRPSGPARQFERGEALRELRTGLRRERLSDSGDETAGVRIRFSLLASPCSFSSLLTFALKQPPLNHQGNFGPQNSEFRDRLLQQPSEREPMLEIRPAKTIDNESIVQFWHQGRHDAHADIVPSEVLAFRTKDHFSLWLKEAQDTFYVATEDDRVLGFVSVKRAEVVKLYVSTRARGTGVAHALLSHAERLLHGAGITRAVLFCTAGNVRAERFYEREGWILAHSFEDALWTPKTVDKKFMVSTYRFEKDLTPTA